MCYEVYLSTDSQEDLTTRNSELVRFKRVVEPRTDPGIHLLDFPNHWYVGSKSECSCTFRHLHSTELGFGEPVEWYPEEQDELEATRELYATLTSLLSSGYQVNLLDRWYGAQPTDITTLNVSLGDVPANAFRLFENHKFRLQK
ncbi:MAG: hypothetical protein HOP18_17365 [Deltaproteobacteria bacterium]|nr:hypothetical protein [Deltaproteobacteria bacterium]